MKQQEQLNSLIESWTRAQQQIWEKWMETLKQSGSGGAQATLKQGMERWQEAVDRTLDAQTESMKAWTSQVKAVEGVPEESKRLAEEGAKMVQQWADAQRALWHQWFGMMGKTVEGGGAAPGADQFKQFMAGWEQVGKQMQDLQKTWASSLKSGAKK